MQSQEFEEVLRFWFPELSSADHARMVRQFEWWFHGGADAAICERFLKLLERAIHIAGLLNLKLIDLHDGIAFLQADVVANAIADVDN